MLKLILGADWTANRKWMLEAISSDVHSKKPNRVLMVPELISHDTERRLCGAAGATASRYAEVLSFSRLARRVADAAGHGAMSCLDEGGRVVAMAAAINQIQSRLKSFAAVGRQPEFIFDLLAIVDEFKRCCVDSGALMEASGKASGVLAQKLEELALIAESYDSICSRGKKDPMDQMTWLLEELECSDYAASHVFYIDGFPDFTRQHMAILEHLVCTSPEVVVSLNCDALDSTDPAFEAPADTAKELLRIARAKGVQYQILQVEPEIGRAGSVARKLFQGDLCCQHSLSLTASRFDSVFNECEAVAEHILETVRAGCRFRDISVVCGDMGAYRSAVNMVFKRCGIPVYVSGTESILDKPVIATVLSALDAALGGFEQREVLRYLKTALSPLELRECDLIENYVLLWGISGNKWTQQWTKHPGGLVDEWTQEDRNLLQQLNDIRTKAIDPLLALRNRFRDAKNVGQQILGLYDYLEQIRLAKHLQDLAQELDAAAEHQNAQVLNQLWEILVNALEQMYDLLGCSMLDDDVFCRLLRILLSKYDAGTIPTVLDSVTVGPVNAMRCQECKHLYVLGALEGALPGYGSASGILTDQDRSVLRRLGLPLNGGAADHLRTEFSEIYGVFCGAEESIHISFPAGQPSYLYLRLMKLAGDEQQPDQLLGAAVANQKSAAAYLLQHNAKETAGELELSAPYEQLDKIRTYAHGHLSRENVEALYGKHLKLSASQIDRHANCAMSYFLQYGLRARERKPATVDPAEFGTFVHDVLEKTGRQIVDLGGFQTVGKEETLQIAREYAQAYIKTHFADLDSERIAYLFRRNGRELELIVEELWRELHESSFAPVMFELSFGGKDAAYPAIDIRGRDMDAKVRGFVDRVDVWKDGEQTYYRVVDYKTGAKSFDYCDVVNGIGLQMLLYLFALEDVDSVMLGNGAVPAGVQYFPARAPVVSVDSVMDEQAAAQERDSHWKRSGLLLKDETVLQAMEPGDKPNRMPYKRRKDGAISGDLADASQLRMLKRYIFSYLESMVDDISSGNVTANPYTRDAKKSACRYCPYGEVCHKSDVPGRRVYQAINADRFWEDVSGEVKKRG